MPDNTPGRDGSFLDDRISRRSFLRFLFSGMAGLALSQLFSRRAHAKPAVSEGRRKKGLKGKYDLVVAGGSDPFQMTVQAVEAMGGMGLFVRKGDVVVVKPNIGWDKTPEQAANTNPHVVAALVELCFKAGARRVNVFDVTCNAEKRTYENSGIRRAAEEKGAKVYFCGDWNYVSMKLPYESPMNGWPVFRDAVDCDVFINVPVLKHHGLTGLTLSMKNLMGVCSGVRGTMHQGIGRKLVDLTDFISPDLTVIDGFRMLVRNGPTGGNLADVEDLKKVIVATDPTLADAYACRLAGSEPQSVPNIAEAVSRKFGSADIGAARIFELEAKA